MFEKLRQKWGVSNVDLIIILFVFAITGSLTAYFSKTITFWFDIEKHSFVYYLIKIAVLIFGYQIILLFVALCFGQWQFFWNFEKKMLKKLRLMK